ncbi:MAG: CinA family protein [Burkholderiaceae bacterium]
MTPISETQALTSQPLVRRLAELLLKKHLLLATAESCTGGLISAACTDLAGSSDWFERGFISYANAAKTEMLGVDPELLANHGAVSEEVARAMALGALSRSRAQVALAVTGVAGPGGASVSKPVGMVCFGFAVAGEVFSSTRHFEGDRTAVRAASVHYALEALLSRL